MVRSSNKFHFSIISERAAAAGALSDSTFFHGKCGRPNDANGDSSNINFELNQGVLSRLEGLDPGVAGIRISETNWVDGAGQAIAHSTCLKRLCLWIRHRESYDFMIRQLFNEWLPRNRSIETFSILDGPSPSGGGTISFSFLTPFFENNDNLRCIQLSNIVHMKPWDIEPIVRALSACKKNQLERIEIQGVRGTDEERAEFFTLLTSAQQGLLELHITNFFDDQRGAPTKMAYDDSPPSLKILHPNFKRCELTKMMFWI